MANKNLDYERNLMAGLEKKLELLKAKKERLEKQLESGFDMAIYRQLSITIHSIECCNNRINGTFLDPLAGIEIAKPKLNK